MQTLAGSVLRRRTFTMPVDCGLRSASPPFYDLLSFSSPNLMMPGGAIDMTGYPHNGYSVYHRADFPYDRYWSKEPSIVAALPAKSALYCHHAEVPVSGERKDFSRVVAGRRKKRVRFADDDGLALETVRVMSEPSQYPPRLDADTLALARAGAAASATLDETWRLAFEPPAAADYCAFRRSLASASACLEHVSVSEHALAGTAKVRDVAYEKDVGVRVTFDSWGSHVDIPASYVNDGGVAIAGPGGGAHFNTFSFVVHIPPEAEDADARIEFCVYFRSGGEEHWDSNGGENYVLLPTAKHRRAPRDDARLSPHTDVLLLGDIGPDFAIWNMLDTSRPYW
ncbi:PREDICTED: protein phosphatase 1 regulatory subunit 3B-like [Priapulus caudatus]|uniref:Protein phosphatase 1 regulatory subunit 3B-like n=1 Tax=Priapulus caudatus TaxID=37621 RepID=A0ABM1E5J2_PRICU|nr:PREDICTED: protein phosphatase 1 regulatory subunit 3B-like [Priapulus caudatus]